MTGHYVTYLHIIDLYFKATPPVITTWHLQINIYTEVNIINEVKGAGRTHNRDISIFNRT